MAPKSRLKKIITSVAKVAFSRGLGLVLALGVSALLANRLGTSEAADAFFFARRLAMGFSEAASRISNVMLVPGLVAILATGDVARVRKVWRRYQLRVLLWVLPVAIAGAVLAPAIVRLVGPGLSTHGSELAGALLRVMIFIIPVTVFRAISASMLNAGRVFGVPELMAQFSRFLLVMALLFLVPPHGVAFLAWVMLTGSFLAALTLTMITNRSLVRIKPRPGAGQGDSSNGPGRLFLPGLLVFGVNQALIWVEYGFASTLGTGNIAVLEYGYRLMAILPGLITASLTTVMYTEFSHQMATGDREAMFRSLARALRAGLFILAPIVAFMAFEGESVAGLLLHHGRFDAVAVSQTAMVMRMVAFAGIGMFLSRILIFSMYADESLSILRLVVLVVIINFLTRLLFIKLLIGPMGPAGIALGRSLSVFCRMMVVFFMLYRAWGRFLRLADIRNMLLVVLITLVSMGTGLLVDRQLGWTQGGSFLVRLLGLVGIAGIGFGLFLGFSAAVRLPELTAVVAMVRRRKPV